MAELVLRDDVPSDVDAIEGVLQRAFGGHDEARLVRLLRDGGHIRVAIVATVDERVVGHIVLSRLSVAATENEVAALALAPLAVDPAHQRLGIGSALVRAALAEARALNESLVFVLGDPAFYERFGFSAAAARGFECVYACDAFQSLTLDDATAPISTGRVVYPSPFDMLSSDG